MLLLGSKALFTYTNNDQDRFNKSDFDLVMSTQEFENFISINKQYIISMFPISGYKFSLTLSDNLNNFKYEIEISYNQSTIWLINNEYLISKNKLTDTFGNSFNVPSLEILYLTKKSHIFYPIHYDKNIKDYSLLKSLVDENKLEEYKDYFELRHKEVKERFNKKNPNLNTTNEEFFNRSMYIVGYIFEHDDIHESIKHYERPVYEMIKKDYSKAWCEKDMFEKLPHEYKIKCVQEEAYVIALERYIILKKGNFKDPFLAYKDALQRICTTLCSGFFRDFAINNYFEILESYSEDYVYKFREYLITGRIRKLEHIDTLYVQNLIAQFNSFEKNN
jgi:hypothetical protein